MEYSKIVVLIPHYNNIGGLKKSLDSFWLPETLNVLIVDDGSIEKPVEADLQQLYQDKLNIKVIYNSQNQGIERTLNHGLAFIQENMAANYIARLDCGDICLKERFVQQQEILDKNPEIFLVGSWVSFVDEQLNEFYTYKSPSDHASITNNMYLKCSFIHPSVMFRKSALEEIGLYPTKYEAAEDYAFFFKFVKRYKTYIIPQVLTLCELNAKGISLSKRSIQLKNRLRIILDNPAANPYFILGLIRNSIIYMLPYSFIKKTKRVLFK